MRCAHLELVHQVVSLTLVVGEGGSELWGRGRSELWGGGGVSCGEGGRGEE